MMHINYKTYLRHEFIPSVVVVLAVVAVLVMLVLKASEAVVVS